MIRRLVFEHRFFHSIISNNITSCISQLLLNSKKIGLKAKRQKREETNTNRRIKTENRKGEMVVLRRNQFIFTIRTPPNDKRDEAYRIMNRKV